MTRLTIHAAVLVLAAACVGNGVDDEEDDGFPVGAVVVPTDRLASEQYSGIEQRQRRVIRSESEWSAFWAALYERQTPRPPRPDIDFDDEVAIVAALGERPTAGYAIEIGRVYRTPAGLVAEVVETAPAPDCVLAQAVTAPVDVVRVPVAGREVRFVERQRVRECE